MIKIFNRIRKVIQNFNKKREILKTIKGKNKPNIIIFGQPKSGTTALYYKIKQSICNDYHCLLEPNEEKLKDVKTFKGPILVKNINIEYNNYFNDFEKKIFIVRDPRDLIVSILLYAAGYHKIPESNRSYNDIIKSFDLLRKKETYPNTVSILDLFKELYMWDEIEIMSLIHQIGNKVLEYDKNIENYFVIKYEDFINNEVEELEHYLGFSLIKESKIDKSLNRVIRTKGSGSWRDWFLEEDIIKIRPLIMNFMKEFNYDFDDWRLNNPQIIEPKHCSEYVLKILNEKRVSICLEPIVV